MNESPDAQVTGESASEEPQVEAPVAEADAPQEPVPAAEAPAEESPTPVADSPTDQRTVERLFQFSGFVHVGPGAADCEDGEDGSCGDPLHFHAWCRLPNKFQIATIRTKAQAAKARMMRRLKDSESDAHTILEADLEVIRDAGKETMVEEVLSRTYWQDHLSAMKELAEDEEGDFSNIEDDQRRFKELAEMSEADRPTDEYEELVRHLDKWNSEVDRVRDENQRPQREGLEQRPEDDLLDLIRNERIKAEADREYMEVYSAEEWVACTMKPRPKEQGEPVERMYGDIEHLKQAAPEIVVALETFFAELEGEFGRRAAVRAEGNS